MNSWSRETALSVRFSRPPRDLVLALRDQAPASGRPAPRFDLKELQRRAFERGRTVEKQESSGRLEKIAAELAAASRRLVEMREQDRLRVQEFAARLAVLIAEKVVGRVLADGQHDPAAMVRDVLGGIDDAALVRGAEIRLSPDDHARLLDALAAGSFDGRGLTFSADPHLGAGQLRLLAGDAEYWSDAIERLESIRQAVFAEAGHVEG